MDNSIEMAALGLNGCEGCQHCTYAGIRWPASPDGFTDLSYVDRCDYCEIYDSDEAAAKKLAEHLDVRWGYAYRGYAKDVSNSEYIRWEPKEGDGLDYTGWSCFIDHPARDGDAEYYRDGDPVTLNLNPGEARIVRYALQEAGVSMASEWKHGELFAIVERQTIDRLYEEIGVALRGPVNTNDKE